MKLSILDQSPISTGKTAQEALQTSIRLAQLGEELGFVRYWIAEHHDLYGLACPNPDVMLGAIGAQTEKIRIGAGAVLLPYYKPFHVAETYNLLATLYPERIDLGLGRAPGGSAEVSLALSDNYLKQVNHYPNQIDELLDFFHHRFPEKHPYHRISPSPVPETLPQTWVLGTSEKSGVLAAGKGLPYVFGHFMTSAEGPAIVQDYRKNFTNQGVGEPEVIVAVHVICAEDSATAHELALSNLIWNLQQEKTNEKLQVPSMEEAKAYALTSDDEQKLEKMKRKMIIGDPQEVQEKLRSLSEMYLADELMVVTITHAEEAKFNSYRLLADGMNFYE